MTTPDRITLRDEASGSEASILPAFGFNCFSFRPVVAGQPVETLWAESGFGPRSRPSGSGIPILFPFAGRLDGQTFAVAGQTYRLEHALISNGNAIHGFVLNHPWRVVDQSPNRATGQFQASIDDPALLAQWPADFQIAVTYEVAGNALRCDIHITNPDQQSLPFALGTHPYFRLPFGPGSPADCRITVPASACWENRGGLPTGRRAPVTGARDLRHGPRFADLAHDDILTDLQVEDGQIQTVIDDPHNQRRLTQTCDAAFRHCVVYTPPHREAIAIEPWTCVPNPFALAARGLDPGLRFLAPGETFIARVAIRLD